MNMHFLSEPLLYMLLLLLLAWPLGLWMASVYARTTHIRLERIVYRCCGIDPDREMDWKQYALAMLGLNMLGILAVYALQRLQGVLPLNPADLPGVNALVALNAAVSFASNTNWQAYGGETTMSHLTQMVGLTVQNFLSAATGMAVLAAVARGFARREALSLGNFWVDCVRSVVCILLPLSLMLALVLVWQGVPQTLDGAVNATALDASAMPEGQQLALGPVASQVAIKQLGTNGGGFFNVNSAHPFENPTPLTNLLEMLVILLIPAALCITFGQMVGDKRQGLALLAAMTILFVVFLGLALVAEHGGSMEGKEVRFGVVGSVLWSIATTAASNGSVNAMHDSFTALGGMWPMLLMQLGEVVFGGVGSGLYGMLVFAVVTVFVAGLMVGRTPEYLGKKIEPFETKMAAMVILVPPFTVLMGAALAMLVDGATPLDNPGPHGFSEILYAFSSMGNNNGSAFAGLTATSPVYALGGAVAMFVSRYWLIVPVLALAGSLARKKTLPQGPGTLPTHGPLFVGLLMAVVLVVGALTFIPALALGPVAEHLAR